MTLESADAATELSVRAISTMLLHFRELRGDAALRELWRREGFSLSLEHVTNLENFVSLRFTERLTEVLAADSGEADFVRVAASRIASPEAIGVFYYLLKAFGSPRLAYAQVTGSAAMYNRVGESKIEEISESSMTLAYRSLVPERNRNFCEGRQAQFAAIPTIWGLEPAKLTESECQLEGADCCRYHLTWVPPRRSWGKIAGTGAALATILVLHLAHSSTLGFWLGFGLVAAGAGWGAFFDVRRALVVEADLRQSQNQGLTRVWMEAQRRYEDLQTAKAEVDRVNAELDERVEERTRELARANAELALSLSRQKELDRQKTQFFDNVSHELRTPLTLIMLSLEALSFEGERASTDEQKLHFNNMQRSTRKLLRLINNLLELAKLESGDIRLRYEPVSLHELLSQSLAPLRTLADSQRIWLVVEGSASEPVHGDSDLLEDVFQNLVTNALKFTEAGGVTVRISETDSHLSVEVQDTGTGMAAADLPRIFDRFAQADSTGIRRLNGTGIGLALVKEIVALHGGSISVQSELGVGSTFRVLLPKGTAHIKEDLRDRRVQGQDPEVQPGADISAEHPVPHAPVAAAPGPAPSAGTARLPRILLVEDDPDIRAAVASVLRQRYSVIEAFDGQEGRRLAELERPDVIVSDVMMPNMSGLQLTRALRKLTVTEDTPILLLTARRETDAMLEGLEAGANDYVGKPFSPRELIARVETQLRLRNASARAAESEKLATLGLLTTGFAHDIRNPLNGLLNCLDPLKSQLETGGDFELARSYIDLMKEAGQRIHNLAESLLSFSRPSGRQSRVDLAAEIDNTLKVLKFKIPAGIEVTRDVQFQGTLEADAGGLNQVWTNLLDNALRAMGQKGTLAIRIAQEESEVVVSFTDTGVGIAPRDLNRLFQPFFSTRAAGEGTGLGLSMCQRIVLKHQGRIEVQSELGHGATFEVHLPMKRAVTEEEPIFISHASTLQ